MTNPSRFLRALALAVPLLLAAGCSDGGNDDDNVVGPTGSARVRAVLDGAGGLVTVTDGGLAVADATVTLNGIAAVPGTAAGEYAVTLPAPVAPGGAMTLLVSDGETVVQGTGAVPATPAITAPAAAASFDPADAVRVTWTSTTSPTLFAVEAVGATVTRFPVLPGTTEAFTIPAGTLTEGDWTIRMRATNRGTLTGATELGSSMEIAGTATSAPGFKVEPHLLVEGVSMGPQSQVVRLTLGGAVVDGAAVTVNGEAATQPAPGGDYQVQLAAAVAVGGRIDLAVTVGSESYTATGTLPGRPDITAMGGSYASVDPFWVEWTSPVDPERFAITVRLCWSYLPPVYTAPDIPGSRRSYTFPRGALSPPQGGGDGYWITLSSFADGSFTGPVHPASRMNINGGSLTRILAGYC